jgi:hypothetical protein
MANYCRAVIKSLRGTTFYPSKEKPLAANLSLYSSPYEFLYKPPLLKK